MDIDIKLWPIFYMDMIKLGNEFHKALNQE